MNPDGAIVLGRADLHMHTTHSDGAHTPYELVRKAEHSGVSVISITDHDNVAAVREAIAAGEEIGVDVIPGVELSVRVDDWDVHLLAYFVDIENETLLEYLQFLRLERLKRAERIVEKLRAINIPLRFEKVLEKAGVGSVGRPHIATAMVEEGLAKSYHDVFSRYLGFGRPAYVEKYHCSPDEAISLIAAAGGLSFVAHPGYSLPEDILFRLINAGLDGIEVIHPSHSPETVTHYQGIAAEYYLLESGGSDFHGGPKNDDAALGQFTIPIATVDAMRRRLFA